MKKTIYFITYLIIAVLSIFAWNMLSHIQLIKDADRILPHFTNTCIYLRPTLIITLFFIIPEMIKSFLSNWKLYDGLFILSVIYVLIYVIPSLITSYWLIM